MLVICVRVFAIQTQTDKQTELHHFTSVEFVLCAVKTQQVVDH